MRVQELLKVFGLLWGGLSAIIKSLPERKVSPRETSKNCGKGE